MSKEIEEPTSYREYVVLREMADGEWHEVCYLSASSRKRALREAPLLPDGARVRAVAASAWGEPVTIHQQQTTITTFS